MRLPASILIVDDEDVSRDLVCAVLEPLGYRMDHAPNGQAAIARAQACPPDVILLDVLMPDMNGYEVSRTLKAHQTTSASPIVMMTSLDGAEERVRALESGADDFLSKPVDITELRARVKSLVRVKSYHDHMKSYQQELERLVEIRTRDLQIAMERLKTSSLETLYRLVAAAECKDKDTGGHIGRVGQYAEALARELGLDNSQIEDIRIAAPMHDVGKIGIPDGIMLKPGSLTLEERMIMQQHPMIGAQILNGSDSAIINLAESIALTHHERWDGMGYPAGLRGAEIPLPGRIVAVADVFDALCSRRPYRSEPVYPVDRVFEMISEGRGKQFDPDVVDALLSIKGTILTIMATHSS